MIRSKKRIADICYHSICCQVSGLPIAGCLVMLVVDTLLYGIIAAWLDNIIPTEYELKYYVYEILSRLIIVDNMY